jgi:hypothetical protein
LLRFPHEIQKDRFTGDFILQTAKAGRIIGIVVLLMVQKSTSATGS